MGFVFPSLSSSEFDSILFIPSLGVVYARFDFLSKMQDEVLATG